MGRHGRRAAVAPGGSAALLDMDGDGNPFNDVLGMPGRLKR